MSDATSRDEELNWWQRVRRRRWARWTIDGVIFLVILAAVGMWQSRNLVSSGEPAPEFDLVDLDGNERTLDDYRGDQTLVVFWAPWCGVCGQESSNVSRVHSWLGDHVDVISIALDYSSRGDVETFVKNHEVDYPVLLGDHATREAFNVSAFPTMYVLSKDGEIERSAVGYTTTFGLLWRALL